MTPLSSEAVEKLAQWCIFGDLKEEVHADIVSIKARVIKALDEAVRVEREECLKVAWDIASNSKADTFEDLRQEVDEAIRKRGV